MRQLIGFVAIVGLCMGQTCSFSETDDNGQDVVDDGTGDVEDQAGGTGAIIANHLAATAFDSIPASTIQSVQSNYRIWYGHTSHGSQILTGMQMIQSEDERFAFNAGPGSLSVQDDGSVDLGHGGDLAWVGMTQGVLDRPDNDVNVVMWSWCGGASDNTEAGITAYLNAMNQLETQYPNVVFIYMTGHLDGTGATGNLYARNRQIRDYCRAHGKTLFDFADIESYDPAGDYYPDGTDACEWCTAWATTHTSPACEDCAHSHCFNCYRKGRAFWWMMAQLAD